MILITVLDPCRGWEVTQKCFVNVVVYSFSIHPPGLRKDRRVSHIAHFTSAPPGHSMPNVELKDLILIFAILVAFVVNCIFVYVFIYLKRIMSPLPMDESQMWVKCLIMIFWLRQRPAPNFWDFYSAHWALNSDWCWLTDWCWLSYNRENTAHVGAHPCPLDVLMSF